jgi:hypothetical protein
MGARSVLSAAVYTADQALGAIKVYSTAAAAYDETSEDILRRFAEQAAIFVSNVQTVEAGRALSASLRETLRAREVIAIAKGLVMARKGLDHDAAYRHLMALSHSARIPVRQLAERIVSSDTGRSDNG